jgi:hypothetical protein
MTAWQRKFSLDRQVVLMLPLPFNVPYETNQFVYTTMVSESSSVHSPVHQHNVALSRHKLNVGNNSTNCER